MIDDRREPRRFRRRWVLLGLFGLVWAAFSFFDREGTRTIDLGQPERLTVIADSGPIHVVERLDGALATVEESWMFGRPRIERGDADGTTVLRVTCGSSRCRAAVRVEVGPGIELVTINDGDVIQIDQFSGALSAISTGSSVELGAVVGSVRVTSDGSVRAARLDADVVDVAAPSGDVDLQFVSPPAEVTVRAGDGAVALALPVGDGYDVQLAAESVEIDEAVTVVDRDEDDPPVLPGRIVVRSSGALSIVPFDLPADPG